MPLSVIAGFVFMFIWVACIFEPHYYLLRPDKIVQTLVALISTFAGVSYACTYIFSLIRTLDNKKISLISFLPVLHGVVAVAALCLWDYVSKLYM